jgi:hypothetical protein
LRFIALWKEKAVGDIYLENVKRRHEKSLFVSHER